MLIHMHVYIYIAEQQHLDDVRADCLIKPARARAIARSLDPNVHR